MTTSAAPDQTTTDAVVVGAGFSGLYMTHLLVDCGMDVIGVDAGDDVGGTWYWNRYPGARTDSEGSFYAYTFSQALSDDWEWSEKFPAQPEVLAYLQHVADRFDLRRHYRFRTTVTSATFDEDTQRWLVTTAAGDTISARFLISGVGVLSATIVPDVPGLDSFRGQWMHPSRWPEEPVDFTGKRVALVGTGSTGIQLLPQIAPTAEHVTVFQRTPNYVVPMANKVLSPEERAEAKKQLAEVRRSVRNSAFAMPYSMTGRSALAFEEAERTAIYEEAWAKGGFRFMIESFDDITADIDANHTASEFLRDKIREIVKDPHKAAKLLPTYPYTVKRPPSGIEFLEQFNRDTVDIVDVRETPVTEMTEDGIRTSDGVERAFDVVIFATGFDAVTGSIAQLNITGRHGTTLDQKWAAGPVTYLSLAVNEFPNFFMIGGPHYAGGNFPTVAEEGARWVAGIVTKAQQEDAVVEVKASAEREFTQHVNDISAGSLMLAYGKEAHSYNVGGNVEGKPIAISAYMGGANVLFDKCDEEAAQGYPAFDFTS
jgi:cation diffusion facilitator CzcD-associated flavoprotein CzcO